MILWSVLDSIKEITNDVWYVAFAGIIIADFVTGFLKAFVTGTYDSSIGLKGLLKHFYVLIMVTFVGSFFVMTGHDALMMALKMFYILNYAMSIYENCLAMGIPLPEWLISAEKIKKMRGK